PAAAPATTAAPPTPDAAPAPGPEPAAADDATVVHAPNLGTFYRAPKPGAAPYVEVGQRVEADTEVCLIEVMKLFTPVVAGVAGTVQRVLVEDGDMVEHDQALFHIAPGD
ncbi:acetyl-CoA carboxylase biotin carboxyl carrier protein, partial [Algiphilus sp.]|uniref:acetyl-CoA carboxylase biotin carboxyl carrier protein n=1 Tax=Algiphilus sp. TaxID=1872431 RepID=UPI003C4D98DF